MLKINIDGIDMEVEPGLTVLQAIEKLGKEVPRFCYHEKLSIAGNCRMCLVEISPGPPKPAASCAMPCQNGMMIKTDSPMVKKAREGVIEFLLMNHPLDCPICDQAGECDLQDQSLAYGRTTSRYQEEKRSVLDKDLGPLISTVMTRCIQCTRCIRFCDEIAGSSDLGGLYRGEHMEIAPYLERALDTELSGNLVDICPVGALTNKTYAFLARPWELRKVETIDVFDSLGSSIRVDLRNNKILRVVPRRNDSINEEWISDKTRYAVDALSEKRINKPYIRDNLGVLRPSSWGDVYFSISKKVSKFSADQMCVIAGQYTDVETLFLLRQLTDFLKITQRDCREDGAYFVPKQRSSYIFNSSVNGIDQADAILMIGVNPRIESAVLNARIRKRYLEMNLPIALIGVQEDLKYPYEFLGNNLKNLSDMEETSFFMRLKKAKNPMIILGASALIHEKRKEIFEHAVYLAQEIGAISNDWNGFNILHPAASRVGGLDVGFHPKNALETVSDYLDRVVSKEIKLMYLLGADEIDLSKLKDAFVIYQGHHGDKGARIADIVLPSTAYTEKEALYTNLEGRVQTTEQVVPPLGDSKEDYRIVLEMARALGCPLDYKGLGEIRQSLSKEIFLYAPENIGEIRSLEGGLEGKNHGDLQGSLQVYFKNFYMTCSISRSSKTMMECSKVYGKV